MMERAFSDFTQAFAYTLNTLPEFGPAAILEYDRKYEKDLSQLALNRKNDLIVPEVWKELLPQASLLVSSALSGGEIQERFEDAARCRSCWLLIEPMCIRFPLPFPNGIGTQISEPPNHGLYSKIMCCYYAHNESSVILWDTEETIERKMHLARSAGFKGFVKTDIPKYKEGADY